MDLLCKWCGEVKPEELFTKRVRAKPYSQSNVRNCRQCQQIYQQKRYGVPKLRAKQLKANVAWRKAHPEAFAKYAKRLDDARPGQRKARERIAYLIRRGRLFKKPCEVCGAQFSEAHHDSYAKSHWETVHWLCKSHHENWHQRLDPVRDMILAEPLAEALNLRKDAEEIQAQITALRDRHREKVRAADKLELDAWNRVVEAAQPLFEETFSKE
jgi:DNA repair exonuclease SbcCD ATPase subunit